KLPIWIAAGFAARCARHLFPYFDKLARAARWEARRDVYRALYVAECFAARGCAVPDYAPAADADHALDAISDTGRVSNDPRIISAVDAAAAAAYVTDIAMDLAAKAAWARRDSLEANTLRAIGDAFELADLRATVTAELADVVRQCQKKQ